MPAMLFCVFTCIFTRIYMYICERSENTRVGAKSASWRSGVCEQFALPHGGNWKHGEIWNVSDSRKKRTQQHRAICKSPLRHTQKTSCQYQWLMFNDQWSMTSTHSSLFTLHFSLFTALSPPTSILISHNDSSWLVHQKCCTFASNLKQVLGVSLPNPNTP